MTPLEQALKQYEIESQLEEARRRAQRVSRPTFAGSVLHGMTLGYAGDKPENITDYIGDFLGGMVPYALAATVTGPAVVPLGAALNLGKVTQGVRTLSPVATALLHGGMTGALAGGVRNAETPTERLQNAAVEGTLGALIPAGLAKVFGKGKVPMDYNVNPKPEPLPEGWAHDPGLKYRAYPPGAYSGLPQATQLELPGMTPYNPRAMQSEADMLNQISRGNILAEPQTAVGKPGEITNLLDMKHWRTANVPLQAEMEAQAVTAPERAAALAKKAPVQPSLFPEAVKGVESDFGLLTQKKGFTVHPEEAGVKLIGPGGSVEYFPTPEDAIGYLRIQPDRNIVPVEAYGTFDKMVNGIALGGDDRKILALQKQINRLPDFKIGRSITDGIKPLAGRASIDVIKDFSSREGVDAATQELTKLGYEVKPLVFGDAVELAYMRPRKEIGKLAYAEAQKALKNYTLLREGGPRALAPNYYENIRTMARNFGMDAKEIDAYALKTASSLADDPQTRAILLGQMEAPQLHRSPLISEITSLGFNAELIRDFEFNWFGTQGFLKAIRNLSPAEREIFSRVKFGELPIEQAPMKVRDALRATDIALKDFAERLSLGNPLKNYFTHVTDMDALWKQVSGAALNPVNRETWLKKLGGEEGEKLLRRYATQYGQVDWQNIPDGVKKWIKKNAFKWEVSDWDKLPPFLRDTLPESVYNRFVLPRTDADIPFLRDPLEVMTKYVDTALRDIHFTPFLQKVSPIINAMPGAGLPLSERTYLEQWISRVALGAPDKFSELVKIAAGDAANKLGMVWADPNTISKAITFYRGRTYGGLLALDSAFRHLNKIGNVLAENGGKFSAIALKKLPYETMERIHGRGVLPRLAGVTGQVLPIEEGLVRPVGKTVLDKAIVASNAINNVMLSPMQGVEWFLRGLSMSAGFDEAVARGLDFKQAMRLSLGKMSNIVPDIALTEAQMAAMRNVLRTDFGYTAAQMPPLWSNPLARLSTMFISYPTRELEFLIKGITSSTQGYFTMAKIAGTAEALKSVEYAKLARYLMLMGVMGGAPYLTAKVGVDTSNFFGAHSVNLAKGMPFWQNIGNAYNAIVGDDPLTRRQAQEALSEGIQALVVPSWRMGKQASEAINSLQRGYTVDKEGHKMATASPFGELMRGIGVPLTSYTNSRYIANAWRDIAHEYNRERAYATSEFLRSGKMDEIKKFEAKWGVPIKPQDLAKAVEISQMSPEARAMRGVQEEVRMLQMQQKPWLVGGM